METEKVFIYESPLNPIVILIHLYINPRIQKSNEGWVKGTSCNFLFIVLSSFGRPPITTNTCTTTLSVAMFAAFLSTFF